MSKKGNRLRSAPDRPSARCPALRTQTDGRWLVGVSGRSVTGHALPSRTGWAPECSWEKPVSKGSSIKGRGEVWFQPSSTGCSHEAVLRAPAPWAPGQSRDLVHADRCCSLAAPGARPQGRFSSARMLTGRQVGSRPPGGPEPCFSPRRGQTSGAREGASWQLRGSAPGLAGLPPEGPSTSSGQRDSRHVRQSLAFLNQEAINKVDKSRKHSDLTSYENSEVCE